jgi:hypothetical protein
MILLHHSSQVSSLVAWHFASATVNTSLFLSTCGFGMELIAALFPMTAPSNHSQRMSAQYTILKIFQQICGPTFLNSFYSSERRFVTIL